MILLVPILLLYGALAYFLLPFLWRHYEHQKKLDGLPMVTSTAQGIPADPINIGLVGSEKDVLCAMHKAGWYAADPITWKSSLEISDSVIMREPYPTAPVSPLFYAGKREDLAFEKPVGHSADQRHHMRLWMVLKDGEEKRPGLARLRDLRPGRRLQPLHRRDHSSHRARRRRRTAGAGDRSAERGHGRGALSGHGSRPTLLGRNGEGRPLLHRRRGLGVSSGGGLREADTAARGSARAPR